MADLDAIKRRIAALLNMTEARGCTDAEAVAAAAKAAELMREYGLSEVQLGMGIAEAQGTCRPTVLDDLWRIIAYCTGCVSIVDAIAGRREYIGREPGPTIAAYLHTYLARCVDGAVARYKASPEYRRRGKGAPRRRACEAFRQGMANQLGLEVWRHFGKPDDAALAAARAEMERRYGGSLRTLGRKTFKAHRQQSALAAGARAAEGVAIRHAVDGEGEVAPRAIGGRRDG